MGYHRLSVTVPDDVFQQLKAFASARKMKVSHIVAEAIAEKNRRLREESFVEAVNEAFGEATVREDQAAMAEAVATHTAVDELPW